MAYTRLWPDSGWEFDAVSGVQFYTRNNDTDYQECPLLTLDLWNWALRQRMERRPVVGTVQQLGKDSGTAGGGLNGFVGRDWAVGPIATYDTD